MVTILDGNGIALKIWYAAPLVQIQAKPKMEDAEMVNKYAGLFARMFVNQLMVIQKEADALADGANRLLICWDTQTSKQLRKTIYPAYKANRHKDEDKNDPFALIAELKKKLKIVHPRYVVQSKQMEADDLIALWTTFQKGKTLIVSRDADLFQLVSKRVRVYDHGTGELWTRKEHPFSVPPEKWAQFKSVVGDSSDNWPGVKGIGPKRFEAYLRSENYGSDDMVKLGLQLVTLPSPLLTEKQVNKVRTKFESIMNDDSVPEWDAFCDYYDFDPSVKNGMRIVV